MQRFRAVLHFIDPLLRAKHKLFLTCGRTKYSPAKFYVNPWNIHAADQNAMIYLCKNFGLQVESLNKVGWTNDKHAPCDLSLSIDARGVDKKRKTEPNRINIPYMGFHCYTPKGCVTVGNPLCQSIRERQIIEKEEKGSILIIHPGGGRDFLSPKRSKYSEKLVINNNIRLMNETLSHLEGASKITIKTHPAPYRTCDCESMTSKVLPSLKASCPVSIQDEDLIGLICKHEFIINYGSSTSIWLLGSPKKWVNIIGQCKFNLKSKNRRDRIERAEKWWEWPQNISLKDLGSVVQDYDTKVDRSLPFMKKYIDLYKLDAVSKCMELIEQFGEQK